jgi:hypothetical protein
MDDYSQLIDRIARLLDRVEQRFLPANDSVDWNANAFRWDKSCLLKPVAHPHRCELDDLLNIHSQKANLTQNTQQFVRGKPANNALLWGSRGTGKSSLIKAMLGAFADQGLRLVEVDKTFLVNLADIVELLYARPERFILFTDDLSFEASDPSYKTLKAVLDGSIVAIPDNVLIYATSNRRHLMPENMQDNLDSRQVLGELHESEAVEEKISLSERFGLWLSFYPFSQDQYLETVTHWLRRFGVNPIDPEAVRTDALRWALARGSRSGRVAMQFARGYAGNTALTTNHRSSVKPSE